MFAALIHHTTLPPQAWDFPKPARRISPVQARWRHDGGELFYVALDGRLMAVPIRLAAGQTVSVGAPTPILSTRLPLAPENLDGQQYVVSRDGQRFLFNTVAQEPTSPIKVILNWTASRED